MKSAQWDIVERQERRIRRELRLVIENEMKGATAERRKREADDKWLREVEARNSRPNRGPSLPTFDENWKPE
jgi:hypothetical protein